MPPAIRGVALLALASLVQITARGEDRSTRHRFPGFERSLACVEEALKAHPDSARLLEVRARVYFRNGRFDEAVRRFEAALLKHSGDVDLYSGLAASYSKLGEPEKTIGAYHRLLALGDKRTEVRARLGIADELHTLGRYKEEIRELQKVPPRARDPRSNFELGRALELVARSATAKQAASLQTEALSAYDHALKQAPDLAEALYARGRLRILRGDELAGKKDLETFRRVKKSLQGVKTESMARSESEFEARTRVDVGRALLNAGDSRRALEQLDRARSMGVLLVEVESARGAVLRSIDQPVDAAKAYVAILEIEPENPEALWNLGKLAFDAGDAERAEKLLLRALQARPRFVEGWEFLATVSFNGLLLPERSEAFATRALSLRPSPRNYLRLARVLKREGKTGLCEELLSQALKRYPGHRELESILGEIRGGGR